MIQWLFEGGSVQNQCHSCQEENVVEKYKNDDNYSSCYFDSYCLYWSLCKRTLSSVIQKKKRYFKLMFLKMKILI